MSRPRIKNNFEKRTERVSLDVNNILINRRYCVMLTLIYCEYAGVWFNVS